MTNPPQPTSLPTVAVGASAQRSVTPDSYVVTARTVATAPDSAAAAAGLAARDGDVAVVLSRLAHLSLDVERGGVSVHPDWTANPYGGSSQPSGWRASRELRLTGRDATQVAELVGALARVVGVEIEGPYWQLDRDNPVHTELAAEAVHEAVARARRYAAALGGTLGRLAELSDTGMGGGREMRFAMSSAAGDSSGAGLESLDFTPQPIDVSASVQGRWYLTLPD